VTAQGFSRLGLHPTTTSKRRPNEKGVCFVIDIVAKVHSRGPAQTVGLDWDNCKSKLAVVRHNESDIFFVSHSRIFICPDFAHFSSEDLANPRLLRTKEKQESPKMISDGALQTPSANTAWYCSPTHCLISSRWSIIFPLVCANLTKHLPCLFNMGWTNRQRGKKKINSSKCLLNSASTSDKKRCAQ